MMTAAPSELTRRPLLATILLCLAAAFAPAAPSAKGPAIQKTADVESLAAQSRLSENAIAAYPQHKNDAAELLRLVHEFEKTSAGIAALEAGNPSRPKSPESARAARQL